MPAFVQIEIWRIPVAVCKGPHVLHNASEAGPFQVFVLKTSCLWRMKTQIPCCCFGDVYGPLTRISNVLHLHRYFRECAADLSWDGSSGCVRSSEAHWGSDSSRWWNCHANSLLPAPPTHHLQDWACQGVTGSRPYLLTRDHSCVFSFPWYIHTRLMINQHKMAHTVWNTCQTDSGRTLSTCAITALHL